MTGDVPAGDKGDEHLNINASLQSDLAILRKQMDAMFEHTTWIANDVNARIEAIRVELAHKADYVNHNLYLHLQDAVRVRDLYYRDLMIAINSIKRVYPTDKVYIETDYPIALDTDDHLIPWGTAQDNTRSPRFVNACERFFDRKLTFIDLGCSGGGLVLDFILRGHSAYGIEGSDFSKLAARAEWRVLENNLLTADITKPFTLRTLETPDNVTCDVMSAWEVMEHIADHDLETLFDNILRHLKDDGIFVGSIALGPDDNPETGASYHRTVQTQHWWQDRFRALGMEIFDDHGFGFGDFCRGTGNGPIDGNFREQPELGFHFVARRLP